MIDTYAGPKKRRAIVVCEALYRSSLSSPMGEIVLVTDAQDRLCSLDFMDHEYRTERFLQRRFSGPGRDYTVTARASLKCMQKAFDDYFDGDMRALGDIPIRLSGTEFQIGVWRALQTIPVGFTVTYGDLAAQIGKPRAVRAVGAANGANPVGLVVPCHRVIGADGSLTGYGGGLARKRWLLIHEGASNELLV